jgi:short-subunit dehydrogenase
MHLRDRVIIVTGASRGIGLATARLLAAKGAIVVSVARDATELGHLHDDIGGSVVVADLAEASSPDAVVTQTLAEHGRLDGLVSNAGVGYVGDVAGMTAEQAARLVDVNLRAPVLLARAAISGMRETARSDPTYAGGLVFVGSIAGAVGVPGESVYSATKAGLDTFAEVLREELRGDPITVSTIVLGVVATRFLADRQVAYTRRYPRPMSPERVADSVVRALETGVGRVVVPRWLVVPSRLAGTAPGLYRRLARRLG